LSFFFSALLWFLHPVPLKTNVVIFLCFIPPLHPFIPVCLEKCFFTVYRDESAKYMIHADIAVPALPPFPPPPRGSLGEEGGQETLRRR
jgi:hypothetical protein